MKNKEAKEYDKTPNIIEYISNIQPTWYHKVLQQVGADEYQQYEKIS